MLCTPNLVVGEALYHTHDGMSQPRSEGICAICRKPLEPIQARYRAGLRELHLGCLEPKGTPSGRRTVLVVDDEPEMRGVLREILAPRAYAVLDTGNPEEALQIARAYSGPIHVMLTDVVMPGIEGPELAEHVAPLRPGIKIVFMSAYDVVNRLKPGVAFLSKPFTVTELMAKLAEEAAGEAGEPPVP
jgi:CheY-like chemotaxis protein